MLHGCRVKLFTDGIQPDFALIVLVAKNAYLDELMRIKAALNFAQHARLQTLCANHDNGLKAVGGGFELLAFSGCQLDFHVAIITGFIRAPFT